MNPETGAPLPIGITTDENGVFIILNAPSGKYIVRVSMIGNVIQEREIAIGDSEINLGKIELAEDTKSLQEVVVTGQKSQLSVNAERRIFNVSSNIAATGASADELLAAVPSVDVNSEGEISLRGNADVLVWINGKRWGWTMTTAPRYFVFLRLGTNFRPDDRNDVYLSAIGTLGHKWGRTTTTHLSNVPGQWVGNVNNMRESGDTRGANVMLGYKHTFNSDHFIDMNVSYNIWRGPNDNQFHEMRLGPTARRNPSGKASIRM